MDSTISFTGANLVLYKNPKHMSELDKILPENVRNIGGKPIARDMVAYFKPNKDGFYRCLILDEDEAEEYIRLENNVNASLGLDNSLDIALKEIQHFLNYIESDLIEKKAEKSLSENEAVVELNTADDIKNVPILIKNNFFTAKDI